MLKGLSSKLKIDDNILSTIGNTPMVRLNKVPSKHGVKCEILGKCEYQNPSGSLKDRISLRMIENAEKRGELKPGYVCIVPTSGNTGISMALTASIKGYKCIIVMSEKMSKEKERVIKSLGSEIVRTPVSGGSHGLNGIFPTIERLKKIHPNNVVINQYTDLGNPEAHYDVTAEEILEQCSGKLDMLVIGAGTGGALTGIAKRLKESLPNIKIVGVDPEGSMLAQPETLNKSGFFEVEGIGHDFIPKVLDRSLVDFWIKSVDKDALNMCRELIKEEGLLCGMSSGAVMCAALKAAKNLNENQRVVAFFGDSIRNYMTKFMVDNWMIARDYIPCPNTKNLWWWDKKITDIPIHNVNIVSEKSTIQDAINCFDLSKVTEIPILGDNQKVLGIVKKEILLGKLMQEDTHLDESVSKIINYDYEKVSACMSLGAAATILQSEKFLMVLDDRKSEKHYGILTLDDIFTFVNIKQTKM
ncbi:unnamed protein product [Brassicogethes aeneus]|uniref:cystathionine beta-synthase n=1 Tax=Brassicogethes aeneus TaxID=1431903 RepID=A0A9P0BC45_BRAAE|nr:unnamed protein product [Brassicogethes aeneus]